MYKGWGEDAEEMSNLLKSKLSALLITVFLIPGCATVRWVHPTKGAYEFNSDLGACQLKARQDVKRQIAPMSRSEQAGLAGIDQMMRQQTLDRQYEQDLNSYTTSCLQMNGWFLQRVN
jgi:hypothetical protein